MWVILQVCYIRCMMPICNNNMVVIWTTKGVEYGTHLVSLSNTMSSGESLYVVVRVPVRVVNDDRVCSGQVNTEASSACG